jgi:hypothetical protein
MLECATYTKVYYTFRRLPSCKQGLQYQVGENIGDIYVSTEIHTLQMHVDRMLTQLPCAIGCECLATLHEEPLDTSSKA